MSFSDRIENDICVLSVEEDLTWNSAEEFYFYVETLVEDHPLNAIVLNLEQVRKIDSAGIGKIFSLYKRCQKRQMQLTICNVSDDLLDMIKSIGLGSIFTFHKSEEEALASLQTQ